MTTCPACKANLNPGDLQAGECSACGRRLEAAPSLNAPSENTGESISQWLNKTVDTGGLPLGPAPDKPAASASSADAPKAPAPSSRSAEPDGPANVQPGLESVDRWINQTVDTGGLPLGPAGGTPPAGQSATNASSAGGLDPTPAPSEIDGPTGEGPGTWQGRGIGQTIDASAFPPQEDKQPADELIDGPQGDKGPGTWQGRGIGQTIELGASPLTDKDREDGRIDPRLSQTIEPGSINDDPPGSEPGTWRGRGISQTIDSSNLTVGPEAGEPGTWRNREIEQTFAAPGLKPDDAARMTGVWTVGAVAGATPQTSIKGDDLSIRSAGKAPSSQTESYLVIKSRSFRDASRIPANRSTDSLNLEERPPDPNADYELLDMLGKGGMGVVYAARQASIDRTVALKMLKPDMASDLEQRQKFLAEAAVTGDLDHPNIVPIYDLGTNEEGALFYSMKRVRGTPWMKVLPEKTLPENLEILMKVADAVGFAHSRGIVHRDLKPENVMLGDFGEVLLMDWGLAQSTSHSRKAGSIMQSSMGGTPAYMAPEMATGPIERIGPSSDIYLLGAILYEVISGRPPHTGKTVMNCLFAAAKNEIQPTSHTGELVTVALKAMATAPGDRYGTVRDFQNAIREYQSHSESIALSARADQDLEEAGRTDDYQTFSRALFGFQEALNLWDGNHKARASLDVASLAYARSATKKGDFDLASSLLDAKNPNHQELWGEVQRAQAERNARQQRLKYFKGFAVASVAFIVIGVTVAFFWIRAGRDRAVAAEGKANQAAEDARAAEKLALSAEQQAKVSAENARLSAKQAQKSEADARKSEKAAKDSEQAAQAAKENEEYQAYIARIGLAAAKIDENAFSSALEVLAECKPELRNWEWGRLMHLCRQNFTFEMEGPVNSVAFSPDGQRFVSGSWDGVARIWSVTPGPEPLKIPYGGLYVQAVAFSSDGKYVAIGGNDTKGFAQIFNAADGALIQTLIGHEDAVLSVAFSKDGRRLLTGSYDKTARLWDVETGKELNVYRGHNWWVWSAAFSPDEKKIVTASQDGTAIVWDLEHKGGDPPVFNGHQGPVYAAAFSPDGKYVVSGGYDRRVLVWEPDDVKPFDYPKLASGEKAVPPKFRVFDDHTAPVRSVQFSSDGKLILSGSQDNTVKVWGEESGKLLKTLRGHAGWVYSCAFSPDGQWVLSGSHDQQAKLWSVAAYEEVRVLQGRVLRGHADAVLSATFSSDGTQIVTSSRDRTANTWSVATGEILRQFEEGHEFLASAAVFFPDSKQMLTAAVDNTVRVWDVTTGGQTVVLTPTGRSASVVLSHDATRILTGGESREKLWDANLWDAQTGKLIRSFTRHASEVTAVAFSPDDRTVATGDSNGRCRLWKAETGDELHVLEGHSRKIVACVFTPDGQRLLTASGDNSVGQWDVASGRELPQLVLRHPDAVTSLALTPNGGLALTSCEDGIVRVWNVERAEQLGTLPDPTKLVSAVAISPDGHRGLTVSSSDRTLRMWDLDTLVEVPNQGGRSGPFLDLSTSNGQLWTAAFSPDGDYVLTVGGNGARLWDIVTGGERINFSPHGAVASASFSPDGKRVVTGSWDNSAKIWNAETGLSEMKLAGGHQGHVNSAVFSGDGSQVLTSGDDKMALLWDVASGTVAKTFAGHEDRVRCAVFAKKGDRVLTGSNDKTARIWDAATQQELTLLKGHEWAILSAAISTDGNYVITGSEDTTAKIWDATTAKELHSLAGHTAAVTSVAFSADGRRVLTGSRDNTAKLWDADTGKEILTLKGHSQEVTSVAFSPNNMYVLTGSRDGAAILWLATDWRDAEAPASVARRRPLPQAVGVETP